MRKYESLWKAVKTNGYASVTVDAQNHRTVVMGMRQEKTKDHAFAMLCSKRGVRASLYDTSDGDELHFRLENSDTMRHIK